GVGAEPVPAADRLRLRCGRTQAVAHQGAFDHRTHPRFVVRATGAELGGETPRTSSNIARVESPIKVAERESDTRTCFFVVRINEPSYQSFKNSLADDHSKQNRLSTPPDPPTRTTQGPTRGLSQGTGTFPLNPIFTGRTSVKRFQSARV